MCVDVHRAEQRKIPVNLRQGIAPRREGVGSTAIELSEDLFLLQREFTSFLLGLLEMMTIVRVEKMVKNVMEELLLS